MSGHLPECPCTESWTTEPECICHRLRACEARVREQTIVSYDMKRAEQAERNGYVAALDAARDAVAAVEMGGEHFWSVGFRDGITTALAAIDALRTEKS